MLAAVTQTDPVRLVPVWKRKDPKIADDAKALWRRLQALPANTSADERVHELCCAAYIGDALTGVSTIAIAYFPLLRCRLGFYRCLVSPEHRHRFIVRRLTIRSQRLLGNWSKENAKEKVVGMAAILESSGFENLAKRPTWPPIDFRLIGFTPDGRQIRISWFAHARLA